MERSEIRRMAVADWHPPDYFESLQPAARGGNSG